MPPAGAAAPPSDASFAHVSAREGLSHDSVTVLLQDRDGFLWVGTSAGVHEVDLASGRLDEVRASALVAAYERERRLSGTEHRLLPALLRAAALRFWISRLADWHQPREASLLKPHDPTHFERVLRERRTLAWHAL